MGIHVADEVLWLTGEFPHTVWAKMFHAKDYHSPIDEGGNTAHIGFTTPSGTICRLDLSRTHASGCRCEKSLKTGEEGILPISSSLLLPTPRFGSDELGPTPRTGRTTPLVCRVSSCISAYTAFLKAFVSGSVVAGVRPVVTKIYGFVRREAGDIFRQQREQYLV